MLKPIGLRFIREPCIIHQCLAIKAVRSYNYVIASRPRRRSNPQIAGRGSLRSLTCPTAGAGRSLAMTCSESLELNNPIMQGSQGTEAKLEGDANEDDDPAGIFL